MATLDSKMFSKLAHSLDFLKFSNNVILHPHIRNHVIPSHIFPLLPTSILENISLSPSVDHVFISVTLPTLLQTLSAEKAYCAIKELFMLEKDPYFPKTVEEMLRPEGIAILLSGMAHPSAYHSLKTDYFDILLPAMKNCTETLILDTMYILFRHHIILGKDNPEELTVSDLFQKILGYNIKVAPRVGLRQGDSEAILSCLLYLVYESRQEQNPEPSDHLSVAYPGRQVLSVRMKHMLECHSKSIILGKHFLILLQKLSVFDVTANKMLMGSITANNDPVLTFADLEAIFPEKEVANFLYFNANSFVEFSPKSAAFAIIKHLLLDENAGKLSRFLDTHLSFSNKDHGNKKLVALSKLLLYVAYANETLLSPEHKKLVNLWIYKHQHLFPEWGPIFLEETEQFNGNGTCMFERGVLFSLSACCLAFITLLCA